MDSYVACFRRPADESPSAFGARLHEVARRLAKDERATTVVLLVDDGEVGAPPDAYALAPSFAAAMLISGLPLSDLPSAHATYRVGR
jgi:hypothetical protein